MRLLSVSWGELNDLASRETNNMDTKKFIYYREDDMWIGWLEEFPDYRTQGKTLEELEENLRDIYEELTSGRIPHVHHVAELVVG